MTEKRNQLLEKLESYGEDNLDKVFDLRRVVRQDIVTYDYGKALYHAGIPIFDSTKKEPVLKDMANFNDTKIRRAVLGIHASINMAFAPADASQVPDVLHRLLYGSKLALFAENRTPEEEWLLMELVNFKLVPNTAGSATVTTLKMESAFNGMGKGFENPIILPANNTKSLKLFHPEGITTAASGAAKSVIKGAKTAWGNEGYPDLANANDCYSISFCADVIEWQVKS